MQECFLLHNLVFEYIFNFMAQLKCVLIEDDALARAILLQLIEPHKNLLVAASFENIKDTLAFFNNNADIDLLFLDVELKNESGIQLYEQLPYKPAVIFTTAHEAFAFTAFELGAIDYLKKPITQERFTSALHRLAKVKDALPLTDETANRNLKLIFKEGRSMITLNSNDVLFFEASKDYVKVVTAAKSHLVLITMKELQQKLKPELFLRINKSYIVNKEKITKVENEKLYIQQYGFKVSRMLKKDITKQLSAADR